MQGLEQRASCVKMWTTHKGKISICTNQCLISGHFVFGHVDDTSKLISIKKVGDSHEIKLEISKKIKKYIAKKGSVSLNGISLTVNQVKNNFIILNIIPFTWLNTNLKGLKIGDRINLEVDMLARYVTQNQ